MVKIETDVLNPQKVIENFNAELGSSQVVYRIPQEDDALVNM